ncbi:hypothetical protein, partial [Photobacterium kishitanii]|uniref:hypothetical protein n=1 Tax=Photobacterium kishitanii TaxID=318456 RepID=UPI000AD3A76B
CRLFQLIFTIAEDAIFSVPVFLMVDLQGYLNNHLRYLVMINVIALIVGYSNWDLSVIPTYFYHC